ncbi:MAG TPA: hypothetical protein PKN80_09395, partial [bacterium]|nr:hypothetical protein [bacterium]
GFGMGLGLAVRTDPGNAKTHFCLGLLHVLESNPAAALKEHGILKKLDRELARELAGHIQKYRDFTRDLADYIQSQKKP